MVKAIEQIHRLFNTSNVTISAQLYLLRFYNELGFKETGETYLEDNIPHIKWNYDKIAIIGCGSMGLTYAKAFLKDNIVSQTDILLIEKNAELKERLKPFGNVAILLMSDQRFWYHYSCH